MYNMREFILTEYLSIYLHEWNVSEVIFHINKNVKMIWKKELIWYWKIYF